MWRRAHEQTAGRVRVCEGVRNEETADRVRVCEYVRNEAFERSAKKVGVCECTQRENR